MSNSELLVPATFRAIESTGAMGEVALRVHLLYRKSDPYAFRMDFSAPIDPLAEKPIVWTLGRELLKDGLDTQPGQRIGLGDARIGTSRNDAQTTLIELESQDGRILFAADKGVLTDFLVKTTDVVPFGREMDGVDMEAEITDMFRKRE